MLQAQSLRLRARKKSGDLTTAIVPAGTSFPAVLREPFDLVIARYAATSFFDQLNSVRSIHMRCRMTANVAGHVRLELRNVVANYPFEKSRRFAAIQPNFGHGDHSRLSCGVGIHPAGDHNRGLHDFLA
jgi:hypothetical protein